MAKDLTCRCGSGLQRRELKDARGIFCTYVCDKCEGRRKQEFGSHIFTSLYQADDLGDDDALRLAETGTLDD